jgi:hypothetical protein
MKFFDATMLGLYSLVATIAILWGLLQSHAQQTTIFGPSGAVAGREVRYGNSSAVYGPSGSVIGIADFESFRPDQLARDIDVSLRLCA